MEFQLLLEVRFRIMKLINCNYLKPMLLGCFAAASALTVAQGNFSGAIYTSKADGTLVNQNIYPSKDAVYLNGGPQNLNGSGLPTGTYYFQVTSPSGILLSTDLAECRQVLVNVAGYIAGGTGPCPHANGTTHPLTGAIPVQLMPYNDTPNNGGEYKAWLIKKNAAQVGNDGITIKFKNSDSKTDNFKVHEEDISGSATLSGSKFYDYDADGVWDDNANEPGVEGVRINVYLDSPNDNPDQGFVLFDPNGEGFTTTTDANGDWSVSDVPDGVDMKVCEVVPETGTDTEWVQTAPQMNQDGERCWMGPTPENGGSIGNLNFGNVCVFQPDCARDADFWCSPPGEEILKNKDDGLRIHGTTFFTKWLNPLCLYWENGTQLVFNGNTFEEDYRLLCRFLNEFGPNNMSNMLSVDFLVLKINFMLHEFCTQEEMNSLRFLLTDVSGLAECWSEYRKWGVYTPVAGFTEISSWANHLLCYHTPNPNLILGGDPYRPYYECAKDLCVAFNNNSMRALMDGPCDVIYFPENP
jgi:hypothetical protein